MYKTAWLGLNVRKRFFDGQNYQIVYCKSIKFSSALKTLKKFTKPKNRHYFSFKHFFFSPRQKQTLFSVLSFPYNTDTLSFHYPRPAGTKQHQFIFPNIIFYKQPRARQQPRLVFLNCSFRGRYSKRYTFTGIFTWRSRGGSYKFSWTDCRLGRDPAASGPLRALEAQRAASAPEKYPQITDGNWVLVQNASKKNLVVE